MLVTEMYKEQIKTKIQLNWIVTSVLWNESLLTRFVHICSFGSLLQQKNVNKLTTKERGPPKRKASVGITGASYQMFGPWPSKTVTVRY